MKIGHFFLIVLLIGILLGVFMAVNKSESSDKSRVLEDTDDSSREFNINMTGIEEVEEKEDDTVLASVCGDIAERRIDDLEDELLVLEEHFDGNKTELHYKLYAMMLLECSTKLSWIDADQYVTAIQKGDDPISFDVVPFTDVDYESLFEPEADLTLTEDEERVIDLEAEYAYKLEAKGSIKKDELLPDLDVNTTSPVTSISI